MNNCPYLWQLYYTLTNLQTGGTKWQNYQFLQIVALIQYCIPATDVLSGLSFYFCVRSCHYRGLDVRIIRIVGHCWNRKKIIFLHFTVYILYILLFNFILYIYMLESVVKCHPRAVPVHSIILAALSFGWGCDYKLSLGFLASLILWHLSWDSDNAFQ